MPARSWGPESPGLPHGGPSLAAARFWEMCPPGNAMGRKGFPHWGQAWPLLWGAGRKKRALLLQIDGVQLEHQAWQRGDLRCFECARASLCLALYSEGPLAASGWRLDGDARWLALWVRACMGWCRAGHGMRESKLETLRTPAHRTPASRGSGLLPLHPLWPMGQQLHGRKV